MHRVIGLFLISITVYAASAQTINLSGKVLNKKGNPISGAIVTLAGQALNGTTNAAGAYSLVGGVFIASPGPTRPVAGKISLSSGIISLTLAKPAPVSIEMFDARGKLLQRALDRPASAGSFRFDVASCRFAETFMVIRVSTGQGASIFRYFPINRATTSSIDAPSTAQGIAKLQAAVDSIKVTAVGYLSATTAITSFQGNVNITMDTLLLGNFSFFVTSLKGLQTLSGKDSGFGGDFRLGKTGPGAGLLGADSICQCLAEASMPGSKVKIWRAFLSVSKDAGGKQVNAIDRIGTGPWFDRIGRNVSSNVGDLLNERPKADSAIIDDLPNEYGVPNHRPDPNLAEVDNHQTVTGSGTDGKLYSSKSTCLDWTSTAADAANKPHAGLSWPQAMGRGIKNWISVFDLWGCAPGLDLTTDDNNGQKGVYTIGNGGGYGGFYCFALTP